MYILEPLPLDGRKGTQTIWCPHVRLAATKVMGSHKGGTSLMPEAHPDTRSSGGRFRGSHADVFADDY